MLYLCIVVLIIIYFLVSRFTIEYFIKNYYNRDTLGRARKTSVAFLSLPGCDKLRTPGAEHLNT